MEKLVEHTYGTHTYMQLKLDDGTIAGIDVYWREAGTAYKVSAGMEERKSEIVQTFNDLF